MTILRAFTVFTFMALLSGIVQSEPMRVKMWGRGDSQFEAVKDAYKKIIAESLRRSTGANLQNQIRRTIEREIEEDIKKSEYNFFSSHTHDCSLNQLVVECYVVAFVQMEEVNGWVANQRAITGSNGSRIDSIQYALASSSPDSKTREFMQWLHGKLEGEFGYDVFYNGSYVSPQAILDNCTPYRDAIKKKGSSGNYQTTLKRLNSSLKTCETFSQRNVAIIVDDIAFSSSDYQERDSSIEGFAKIKLSFFDIDNKRLLPSPKPKVITQYGQGSPNGARAQLTNNLFEASTNYIAQQFNNVALNRTPQPDSPLDGSKYQVTIAGLNRDSKEDRNTVRYIRDWFEDEAGLKLKRDFNRGDSADQVFFIESEDTVKLAPIVDELRYAMDDAEIAGNIDVDRNSNLIISFASSQANPDKAVNWNLNSKALKSRFFKKRIKVESASLAVNRRDQKTGVALSVLQAKIKLANNHKRDLVVSVEPLWLDSNGVQQTPPFSDKKLINIRSGSSNTLIFNAPSRFAQKVELEINCYEDSCKK